MDFRHCLRRIPSPQYACIDRARPKRANHQHTFPIAFNPVRPQNKRRIGILASHDPLNLIAKTRAGDRRAAWLLVFFLDTVCLFVFFVHAVASPALRRPFLISLLSRALRYRGHHLTGAHPSLQPHRRTRHRHCPGNQTDGRLKDREVAITRKLSVPCQVVQLCKEASQ